MTKEELDQDLQDKIDKANKSLDDWENKLGLDFYRQGKCPDCLKMPIDELKRRTPEELMEFYLDIQNYTLYLQSIINRNKAVQRWGNMKLDELAAGFIPEISGSFGFNERILMARHNPEICKRLNRLLSKINMELDRLYGIPDQIRIIAECIKDIKFLALKREKYNG